VLLFGLGVAHGQHGGRVLAQLQLGESSQRMARPYLHEDGSPTPGQLTMEGLDAVGEAHGLPVLAQPVFAAGGLLVGDPGAGKPGQERDARRAQGDLAQRLGVVLQDHVEELTVRSAD